MKSSRSVANRRLVGVEIAVQLHVHHGELDLKMSVHQCIQTQSQTWRSSAAPARYVLAVNRRAVCGDIVHPGDEPETILPTALRATIRQSRNDSRGPVESAGGNRSSPTSTENRNQLMLFTLRTMNWLGSSTASHSMPRMPAWTTYGVALRRATVVSYRRRTSD